MADLPAQGEYNAEDLEWIAQLIRSLNDADSDSAAPDMTRVEVRRPDGQALGMIRLDQASGNRTWEPPE